MILLAILLPGISFLLRGKIISAIIAIILQIISILTFLLAGIGFALWVVLAAWAVISLNNKRADRRHKELIRTLNK